MTLKLVLELLDLYTIFNFIMVCPDGVEKVMLLTVLLCAPWCFTMERWPFSVLNTGQLKVCIDFVLWKLASFTAKKVPSAIAKVSLKDLRRRGQGSQNSKALPDLHKDQLSSHIYCPQSLLSPEMRTQQGPTAGALFLCMGLSCQKKSWLGSEVMPLNS